MKIEMANYCAAIEPSNRAHGCRRRFINYRTTLGIRCLLLALFCAFMTCRSLQAQSLSPETGVEVTPGADPLMQAVAAQVSPAVVRIAYSDSNQVSGVIVTAEGHIASFADDRKTSVANERITIHLADKRQAAATRLGWSSEWGIELLKMDGQGPWPYVEIDRTVQAGIGQPCFLLGYLQSDADNEGPPMMQLGAIEQATVPYWYITSEESSGWTGGGLFDLEGHFLGLTTRARSHTCVSLFAEYWVDLVAGRNIDRVRLSIPEGHGTAGKSIDQKAIKHKRGSPEIDRARSATVRIALEGDKASSGVVVTSRGHVLTCAHGRMKKPGETVAVTFADGKAVQGRILNTNPISDIALIQLEGDGPWPHALWGRSVDLQAGDACIAIGYPHGHSKAGPVMRKTQVVEPEDIDWSYLLWTSDYALEGGESGGGLFDGAGRLVGMIQGYRVAPQPRAAFHARIEVFQSQWDLLRDDSKVNLRAKRDD